MAVTSTENSSKYLQRQSILYFQALIMKIRECIKEVKNRDAVLGVGEEMSNNCLRY